jgi:hypothetical protein
VIKEFSQFNLDNDIIKRIVDDIPKVIYDIWDISLEYQDDHGEMMFVAKYGKVEVPIKMISGDFIPDISFYKDDFVFFCMAIDHLIKKGAVYWYDFEFINNLDLRRTNKILSTIELQINDSYPFIKTSVDFKRDIFNEENDKYSLNITIDRKWN